jgi:tRNA-Thr(GGU) m(6)t(6)A37 methyltransferase TsaA
MEISLNPIGIIHSPFTGQHGTPIQPRFAEGAAGHIDIDERFRSGLSDLEGFSHLHLLYFFHRASGFLLTVTPYLDHRPRGVFATRAPRRPNPIGLSVVRLTAVRGCRLLVEDLDVLDGTPLLDIKPFNPAFDHREGCRVGWMEGLVESARGLSDDRFDDEGG